MNRLYRLCFAPVETRIWSGSSATWCTADSSAAIALRSGRMPPTSVYLPTPLSSAARAASLMWSGVSKSGSPAPKLITSSPSALSLAAFAVTASVIDGLIGSRRDASLIGNVMEPLASGSLGELGGERGDDRRRHETRDVTSEARALLDQRARHVVVALVGHEEHGVDAGREPAVHVRELELVLEVGEGAQAAHDHRRAAAAAEVDEQAVE